uniref:Putative membrane protein,Tapt1/CMV receptor n=1 Tax=Helianthus annuus TaxID=4232 RepID=A0A251S7C2_HELAN
MVNSVERFHIASFLIFVLAQNILEAEGPWFENFLYNALVVYICELMIDIIKHSFIAKFNEIKPVVYSEFLEDLCKQTLNIEAENPKKNLTFVPLAPASVVIRVLSPVYAAHLPSGPALWRLLWILILAVTSFVMLTTLKVMIGMGLRKHATWYIKRCQRRKLHSD